MDALKSQNLGPLAQYREPDAASAREMITAAAKKAGVDVDKIGAQNLRAKDFTNAMYADSISVSVKQFSAQLQLGNGSRLSVDFVQFSASWARQSGDSELLGHLQGLTPDKARALVAEDGYFGAAQTAERIAGFVLAGAGDDVDKLQAGRAGVLQGLAEAKKMFGGFAGSGSEIAKGAGNLADETINRALEAIDKRIAELGGNILDIQA